MNHPLFSVIVPVYNGMPFIKDCIENLCNQTFHDSEILLVDDGSTDGSVEVCEQFVKTDDRINFIRNAHRGVSHSRNCGLSIAKGEWILFMDCDDLYDIEALNTLKFIIDQNPDVDLVSGIFSRIDINNKQLSIFPHKKTGTFAFGEYVSNGAFYPAGACGHCLRHSIIKNNNLRFCEDLTVAEDALFMVHYCAYIRKIVLTDDVVYQYRINPHSMMRTRRSVSKIESQLTAAVMMYDAKDSEDNNFKELKVKRAHGTLDVTILNVAESSYSFKELFILFKSVKNASSHIKHLSPISIFLLYLVIKNKKLLKNLYVNFKKKIL